MFDISIFCRTCMCQLLGNTEMSLKSYNISESLGLTEKLEQCSSIKAQAGDGYPPRVCEICFVKISDFYEFQQMCRHSTKKFIEMVQEHKPQVKYENTIEEVSINGIDDGKDIQENPKGVKCEYVLECDSDNDPLLETTNGIEMVEGVEIERLDLDTTGNLKCNKRKMKEAVGSTADEDMVVCKYTKQENTTIKPNKSERKGKMQIETTKDEITYETNTFSSNEENSECLSEEEESLSEDSDLLDEEEAGAATGKKRLQCSICPKRFLLKRCLESHMRTHQGLMDHPCPRENCGRSYRRLCDLRQHLRDHDGLPREYRCVRGSCNRTFSRYGDLLKHRIEEHGAPPFFKCDVDNCGQEFKTNTYLKRHKETRHSDGPQKPPDNHMCDTCGAVLRSAATLRMHALIHVERSQWPFVCDIEGCSKRFRIQQQLTIHKNRHAGIKNYPCPHCDMRFVTSTNLKNHINTHTWERTWSCEFCPKVCNTPDLLRKHTENKHGIVKRYPCSICHRHFNTANAKMYHEMTHVGDNEETTPIVEERNDLLNRFPCDYCDRAFESQSRKKYHEMTHTGEKPHVCEECGKGFRTTTLLKTHKRSHMKELPRDYVCSVCDRAFFSAQSMRHHEMKHTKEKPYKCEECGFSFRWPNNLARHRKLHLRDKKLSENTQEDECIEVLMEDE